MKGNGSGTAQEGEGQMVTAQPQRSGESDERGEKCKCAAQW